MAEWDCGFDDAMRNAVRRNLTTLVDDIMNIQDILDHLIEKNIFVDGEDILECSPVRKEKNRRFLKKLVTRAAEGFWEFLICLYQPRINCGHLASAILNTYEREGGRVRDDVQMLREGYLNNDGQDGHQQPQQLQAGGHQMDAAPVSGAAQAQGVAWPAPAQYRSQSGMEVTTKTTALNFDGDFDGDFDDPPPVSLRAERHRRH